VRNRSAMKLLIDTNIFIPLEPLGEPSFEPSTRVAAQISELASRGGASLFVHPASRDDLKRDGDTSRREIRRQQIRKYASIENPPELSSRLRRTLGESERGSNDWVDHMLLMAVEANAVDYLISEDLGIARGARSLRLDSRVLSLADAASLLANLFDRIPRPPPRVETLKAYSLDETDPIFQTFREDYGETEFNKWLHKCQLEHRDAWIIRSQEKKGLAGLAIVKSQEEPEFGLDGRLLKLCSFKVADGYQGFRFGELLLKAVFDFAVKNVYSQIYVTVLPRHGQLIRLLETFGFERMDQVTELEEWVFEKPMQAEEGKEASMVPLDFNIRYGPFVARTTNVPVYLVPIQPQWHRLLFPEVEEQQELEQGQLACGNAIQKAYLSRSRTSALEQGSILFFYRSGEDGRVTAVGVVEDTLRTSDPEDIVRFAGTRTVYRLDQIEEMCEGAEVLTILFRFSRRLSPSIRLPELYAAGLLTGAPQSITRLGEEGTEWLTGHMRA